MCCSIAYAELAERTRNDHFQPVAWGQINPETRLVLARFGVEPPPAAVQLVGDYLVVLVDTHHPQQLPEKLDATRVIEIIDHHPAGHPEAFPRAAVQNEEVGAAATLIAERFRTAGFSPSPPVAGLLAAAVISNTLNLSAPSTSERDHAVLEWLRPVASIPDSFVREMFNALSDTSELTTAELLVRDYKAFRIGRIMVGITQIEATEPGVLINRADLSERLCELADARDDAEHVFLSVIGLLDHTTTVVAVHPATRELLTRSLGLEFDGDIARAPRILLRKTDFVPGLIAFTAKDNRNDGA
ncbi:DHH family phosphoesterase [Lentzea sp. HUAS12]|nr:DHH family phosphoesterase [Lentzea sp. HUAS12]